MENRPADRETGTTRNSPHQGERKLKMKSEKTDRRNSIGMDATRKVIHLAERSGLILLLGVAMLFSSGFRAAEASEIVSITGQVEEIALPANVKEGMLVNDTMFVVFEEASNYILPVDLNVDISTPGDYGTDPLVPGVIRAGTEVWSYFVHMNTSTPFLSMNGSIEFGQPILGLIVEDLSLDASYPVVGNTSVIYPVTLPNRGIGFNFLEGDHVILTEHSVDATLSAQFGTLDQFRVIVGTPSVGLTFSIDYQGPTRNQADAFTGDLISEGDILTVGDGGIPGPNRPVLGPLGVPGIMIKDIDLGITNNALGEFRELDALSFGNDKGPRFRFSVDEFASGFIGPFGGGPTPNVHTEGAAFGNQEASADVFAYPGPAVPTAPSIRLGSRCILDGDGLSPPTPARRGMGLKEPNPYNSPVDDEGDNLDAMDLRTSSSDLNGPVFYSLDAAFVDWAETGAVPPNTGSAAANFVSGADILMVTPGTGAIATIYASAATLGLDLAEGEGSDDVDALALFDNGDGVFDANQANPGLDSTESDQIYFSVRRGSAVIGRIDSRLGIPITEADILTVPQAGGLSPYPAIFVPGEAMLLWTSRRDSVPATLTYDDLNALDRFIPRNQPVGTKDDVTILPEVTVALNPIDNDVAGGSGLDPASVMIFESPRHGTVVQIDTSNGFIHYRPDSGFVGKDTLSYIVGDDNGEFSDPTPMCLTISTVTSLPTGSEGLDVGFFKPAFPNPFRSSTGLMFSSMRGGRVQAEVYSISGRLVRKLVDDRVSAGQMTRVEWDGKNSRGEETPTGVYLIRVMTPDRVHQSRIVKLQ